MDIDQIKTPSNIATVRILSKFKNELRLKCSKNMKNLKDKEMIIFQQIFQTELEKLIDQTIAEKMKKIEIAYVSELENMDEHILETARKRKHYPLECKTFLRKKFENNAKAAKRLKVDTSKSEETFPSSNFDSVIETRFKETIEEFSTVKKMVTTLTEEIDVNTMNQCQTSTKVRSDVFCNGDKCCLQYAHPEARSINSRENLILQKSAADSLRQRID